MAVAHGPAGRPAAHIRILERDDERLGNRLGATLPNRSALPKAHHAVVGGHDLVHLRVVDSRNALH